MTKELWRDIVGYEGLYQVSNLGRVRTMPRAKVKPGIMRLENNKGYYRISLSKNGISKHFIVHRLVAQTFIDNPNNYREINHINENPLDNRVENLEWCTHIYNLMYGTRRQRVSMKESKKVNQYDLNGNYIRTHDSLHLAADYVNGQASGICHCCKGKKHTAYGYMWRYESEVMPIYE